jgi:hypothetical protein
LGIKLSERFLFIIFDNARKLRVDEIYVTVFDEELGPALLVKFLEDWGFQYFGTKTSVSGTEKVYVKSFREIDYNDFINPRLCYPFFSGTSNLFIVPIYQQYHTELFPDSILKTESPADFVENMPHRNAISKVYISRSLEHKLKCGDLIIFYRTGDPGRGYYTGVVTTLGIVESVEVNIKDESTFVQICSKRSVFPEEKLREQWNYGRSRPFVVNFLYVYSFPKRPNLKWLHENGIIPDINDMPRGFRKIPRIALKKIFEYQP